MCFTFSNKRYETEVRHFCLLGHDRASPLHYVLHTSILSHSPTGVVALIVSSAVAVVKTEHRHNLTPYCSLSFGAVRYLSSPIQRHCLTPYKRFSLSLAARAAAEH